MRGQPLQSAPDGYFKFGRVSHPLQMVGSGVHNEGGHTSVPSRLEGITS